MLAGALAHSRPNDYVVTAQNLALVGMLRGQSLSSVLDQLTSDINEAQQGQLSFGQLALMETMEKAHGLIDTGNAVLVFCGEDPAALAFQQESLALAAKDKAHVVCFIETTLAALADKARGRSKRVKSPQPQFPVIAVDGADVVAVSRVAQEAVRRARTGHGPSLIQCVMPDEAGHDPLQFIEDYLRRKKLWSEEWRAQIARDFAFQLQSAMPSQSGLC